MKMTRSVFPLFVLGLLLTGCSPHPAGTARPIVLHRDENPADLLAPAVSPAPAPEPAGETPHRDRPVVVFIEFVPTPQDVVEQMLKMARVSKDDVVYDLGCGDGRILVTAAQHYGCRAFGCDLDPLRVREARQNAAKHGVAHLVTIEQQDVLKTDLHGAGVVTLYLGPEINARLIPQLRQLRPGARIVSHDFPLGNLPPDKAVEMTSRADGEPHTLYLWTCPLPPGNP